MRIVQLLILILVLAALVLWDVTLRDQEAQLRRDAARVEQLMDASHLDDRSVAAVRVDLASDVSHLYVYSQGVWRCSSAYGAPALNDAVQAITPALMQARGVVRTSDPADAAHFGFDDPLRVSICGTNVHTDPMGDVIFAIDVGDTIESTGGSFVRPVGSDAIWEIDQNFRDIITLEDDTLPPMLDPRLVPRVFPGEQLGPQQVTIAAPGEAPMTITREQRDQEAQGDQPPWQWIISDGESDSVGDLMQVTSYVVFLTRVEYDAILAPRPAAEVGLAPPRAVIHYRTPEGHELELRIGGEGPRGGVVVYNTFTENFYEIDAVMLPRLLPPRDMLLDADAENPWAQWMQR